METLKNLVLSLEERIKAHQQVPSRRTTFKKKYIYRLVIGTFMQGGFSTNLAPKKLVAQLLNLFDSTAHRVVGPPPVPSGSTLQGNENQQSFGPRVATSQSTMAMSSLVPQSTEPMNEWAAHSNKMAMHTRSVSEPDFGRSPRQVCFDLCASRPVRETCSQSIGY